MQVEHEAALVSLRETHASSLAENALGLQNLAAVHSEALKAQSTAATTDANAVEAAHALILSQLSAALEAAKEVSLILLFAREVSSLTHLFIWSGDCAQGSRVRGGHYQS